METEQEPALDSALSAFHRALAHPSGRAALRRSATSEHYAYPYLAYTWAGRPFEREPVLSTGYLLAASGVDDGSATVGQALGQLQMSRGTDSIGKKLLVVYDQELAVARSTLLTLFTSLHAANICCSWANIWNLCRNWNHPDRWAQRRLLETFYAFVSSDKPAQDKASADTTTEKG